MPVETNLVTFHRGSLVGKDPVAPVKTFALGRRCWCGSILSRYNPGETCYSHSQPSFRRVRPRGGK